LTVLPPILSFLPVACFDREPCAVLVVLAEVRDAAGERAGVADLDDEHFLDGRGGAAALGASACLRFFLAAAVERDDADARASGPAAEMIHVQIPPGTRGG